MSFDVDAALKGHLDRWLYLLGLDRLWDVTYEVTDGPISPDRPVALNVYFKRRTGKRESHITFDRSHITSDREAEYAAIHESVHLLDYSVDGVEQFIGRLERPLRLARLRASRSAKKR